MNILFILKVKILVLMKWSYRFPPSYVDYGAWIDYHILSA